MIFRPTIHIVAAMLAMLVGDAHAAAAEVPAPSGAMAEAAEIPAHLRAIGQEHNDLLAKGFLDVTLYDGWQGAAVDPSGARDSTKGLQKAIEDARDNALTAFFPEGVYSVSAPLNCMKRSRKHRAEDRWLTNESRKTIALAGSTKGKRPVIRLASGCAGFQDAENPQCVIRIWNQENENTGIPPLGAKDGASTGFNQTFRGIDIDLGQGNPGAIGLGFSGAQGSSLEDVRILARNGYAGIYNVPGRAMGAVNVEVVGGRFGVIVVTEPSPILAGLTLINQKERAIKFDGWTPLTLVGFRIVKESSPAVELLAGGSDIGGSLVLIDGSIEVKSGAAPAVDNRAGLTMYMRNVYVSGASAAVQSADKPPVACSGAWTRIAEYAHCGLGQAQGNAANNLIDGETNAREIVAAQTASGAPPADLISRHVWERLPSFEDADAVNARSADIGALGDGIADDAPALQKAIDRYEKVFLPKGVYRIGKTITLGPNTKLFGSAKAHVYLKPADEWRPTAEAAMVDTADAPGGAAYLSDIWFVIDQEKEENDFFNLVTWRIGRNSIVKSLYSNPEPYAADHALAPRSLYRIAGGGGGRWYFWQHHSQGTRYYRPDHRLMTIEGTREPLAFYGLNPEHSHADAHIEIRNAENIRIYAIKTENRQMDVIRALNSRNILIAGHGGHSVIGDGRSVFRFADCADSLAAVAGSSRYNPAGFMLQEEWNGETGSIPQDGILGLFKRGEPDDGVWTAE